jgi:multiple antibiotic resistance protein
MDLFVRSFLLLFVLLNPFILSVYLGELVTALDLRHFGRQLARAMIISFVVFAAFAWAGEALFENAFQVRFFAFRIFGGITFLIIGIRLITGGQEAVTFGSRDEQLAASIAMPFIIGPGTISAAVLAGARLDWLAATLAIALALAAALAALMLFKWVHDVVRTSHEPLVRRYTEIVGRATALFAGSFAIDMILRGIEGWLTYISDGIPPI